MSAAPAPEVQDLTVILVDGDVLLARNAVRRKLNEHRAKHASAVRRGRPDFARHALEKFDEYLDLYELLGGDPGEIRDPEDRGGSDA